jgi:beta-glucosidase
MPRTLRLSLLTAAAALSLAAQGRAASPPSPWLDPTLTPERRADLMVREMTLDEQIGLVHGVIAIPLFGRGLPPGAVGSIGFIPGLPRLGVPPLQETDASLGVANPFNVRPGDGATPLPSGLAIAATFDPQAAYAGGAMIGHEAWSKGLNVLLGGGVDLVRDPRAGRNFEYLGEDPLLAGVMGGQAIRGTQDQHVLSTVKHFAFADQETGRTLISVNMDEAAARESDLLAFELAIETGRPGAVMCAYNRIDDHYACENDHLLNGVLKGDWAFPGFVMSDWGATHSAVAAALAGLDQESGQQVDRQVYFDKPLREAVEAGQVPRARIADMARRILRAMIAEGLIEHPAKAQPIDYAADAAVAGRVAREGIVLLANPRGLLPLARTARSIVVIGGEADAGVLSGGGSSQVAPVGGPGRAVPIGAEGLTAARSVMIYDPSSPLRAIRARAPGATVTFQDGRYPKAAADAARGADIAIVFANQWMGEAGDAPDLSLPQGQDDLIAAVTRANPRTVVVLQTGGPVLMPWLDQAGAVVEAWYSGAQGGEAIADVLFGEVDASGRLPVTFPASEARSPRPETLGAQLPAGQPFDAVFPEGTDAGYRWYARTGTKPLFPFGFGLSYTRFRYSGLTVTGRRGLTVSFEVTNVGSRAGSDTPQAYLTGAGGRARMRLLGWSRVSLAPGETRRVTVEADPRLLADFDVAAHAWRVTPGAYRVGVGASSGDLALAGQANLAGFTLKP